jgi:hypothetical protein
MGVEGECTNQLEFNIVCWVLAKIRGSADCLFAAFPVYFRFGERVVGAIIEEIYSACDAPRETLETLPQAPARNTARRNGTCIN